MGAGCQSNHPMISAQPQSSRKGRGRLSSITYGQCFHQSCLFDGTLMKTLYQKAKRASVLVGTAVLGVWSPWRGSTVPRSAHLSSIWLLLHCVLETKTVILGVQLSWVPWVFLASYWTCEEFMGNPKFAVSRQKCASLDTLFVTGVWNGRWGEQT